MRWICFGSPYYLFFGWVLAYLAFLVTLTIWVTRKVKAACVGSYSEFWFTFLAYYKTPIKDPLFERSAFLTSVDPRDADILLRYRRLLAAATLGVFLASGMAYLAMARACLEKT